MKIKPFRGIRPPKALAKQVSSRPYDVLNSAEAREEIERVNFSPTATGEILTYAK